MFVSAPRSNLSSFHPTFLQRRSSSVYHIVNEWPRLILIKKNKTTTTAKKIDCVTLQLLNGKYAPGLPVPRETAGPGSGDRVVHFGQAHRERPLSAAQLGEERKLRQLLWSQDIYLKENMKRFLLKKYKTKVRKRGSFGKF